VQDSDKLNGCNEDKGRSDNTSDNSAHDFPFSGSAVLIKASPIGIWMNGGSIDRKGCRRGG